MTPQPAMVVSAVQKAKRAFVTKLLACAAACGMTVRAGLTGPTGRSAGRGLPARLLAWPVRRPVRRPGRPAGPAGWLTRPPA